MRRAAERYSEPTDAERALMKDLLVELERANAATDAALVRLEATEARAAAFDEDRYRAETTKRLEAAGIDWSAEIGRAHVCTPVTNAHLVCRILLEKNNTLHNIKQNLCKELDAIKYLQL